MSCHHALHLAGHAGHGNDRAGPALDDEARRSADRVFDQCRPRRDVGLLKIVLGHLDAETGKALLERLQRALMQLQRATGGVGDGLARDIVLGRPESAGDQEHAAAGESQFDDATYTRRLSPTVVL